VGDNTTRWPDFHAGSLNGASGVSLEEKYRPIVFEIGNEDGNCILL
jgi:hypothetical protein